MALITCHECNHQISSAAKACPQCGARPRRLRTTAVVLLLTVLLPVVAYFAASGSSPPVATAGSKGDKELDLAIAAGRSLKQHAKDPSSFKVESFLIFPGGAACYEYRAKNSFGAIVPAKAVFVPPGTLETSEQDGRRFVTSWNAVCTKPGGVDRASGLNLLGAW